MDVDGAAATGASSSGRVAVQECLLAELSNMAVAAKEEARCAACLLLVSLLQLCRGSSLVAARLPQLQATFTGLLGDSNELTQDLAARGVSLVYSRGGAPLQQQLLGQLLGLLQGSGSGPGAPGGPSAAGAAGVKLAGDTKIFEEGQLGNTPGGGGLTTYRELCSLANDLGQPDLIYRFMDLARASSALSAKRGAAVGVARIARLAAAATPGGTEQPGGGSGLAALLGPQRLASLLPKLYRLCHDPSPKVSDSMSAIWAALLDDPRAAVDAHYNDIAKSLLVDVGARLWRVRQAACAGLTDLLTGRRWPQLAPHMEQLWVMGLRAADDVKESVRGAAGGLVRSLRGTSLRIMDARQSPAADVAGCCSVVLPLLAGSQGLGSSVPDIRSVAADVLCSGIKTAGSAQVLPVLPSVVPVLLEALSGMEDARLNYVEQHAESVGLDSDQLAAARLAAARSSSITEALDAASRALTGPAALEMAPALADLVRRGVGLNSKVGTANFIRGLAGRLRQELRPAAPTLLKPLVSGVAREASAPVKRAYAAAAAALAARCCSDKRRDKYVMDAVASYGAVEVQLQPWRSGDAAAAAAAAPTAVDEPSGGSEDAARQAGGLLLRELLKESSDVFNTYASQVLPVAFTASHDESASVASAWAAVWSQGCPSEPAALRLHAPELAGLLAGGLSSSAWPRKRAAAKALSVLAEVAPSQLSPYSPALARLLLAEASGGRLWEGKEGLLVCLGALGAACPATLAQQPGTAVLLSGMLSAAARKKSSYRIAALAAMQKVLAAMQPLTSTATVPAAVDGSAVWGTVSPPLLQALQQQLAAASAPAQASGDTGAGAADPYDEVKPLPLAETCSCLGAAWKLAPPVSRANDATALVQLLSGLMAAAGISWTNWLAVVTLAQAIVQAAAAGASPTPGSGGGVAQAVFVPLAGGLVHVIHHSTVSQVGTTGAHSGARVHEIRSNLWMASQTVEQPAGTAAMNVRSSLTTTGGSAVPIANFCSQTPASHDR
ncbi:armadillo-type protein [Scenedesmus sp. NREL 46B-D3]|nr:armadillo-type protein [Scenedesmus sp. NREL 46B-D3]